MSPDFEDEKLRKLAEMIGKQFEDKVTIHQEDIDALDQSLQKNNDATIAMQIALVKSKLEEVSVKCEVLETVTKTTNKDVTVVQRDTSVLKKDSRELKRDLIIIKAAATDQHNGLQNLGYRINRLEVSA